MGYYSIIFCDGVFFSDKYKEVINFLTDIIHHHDIATIKELETCNDFCDLIKIINTKQIPTDLKNSLIEICISAEKFRHKQKISFTKLFYTFDPDGELLLEDYNEVHDSDNTLVFLVASVLDTTMKENVEILFEGSDNSYWGYLISSDGKGKVTIHHMNRERCIADLLIEVNDVLPQN